MHSAIWTAVSLLLIVEGLGPMLLPKVWKRGLLTLISSPEKLLRRFGGAFVVAGVVIFYMMNR